MNEMLPLPGRHRHVQVGSWSTFIVEAGEGAPVVLFHSSSIAVDSSLTWFRVFGLLAEQRRVIVYDQPGFGYSEIPSDRRYLDRLARAEHAQRLFDQLELTNATLVGHSEGGFIATKLALDNPGRVAKLVIVTSGGTAPPLGSGDDAWQKASASTYDYLGRSIDEETFIRTEGHLRHGEDEPFESVLRSNFRAAVKSGNLRCFLNLAATRTGFADYTSVQQQHILPRLATLCMPALLIWAGSDPTVPVERGLALAKLIPNAEMHVFPHAGHWVMHEATASFNRLLASWL
jgi:pimeloyl-ACP methyl ester carboxylesterase